MRVIAVVVTHNRAGLLQECIYRLCNIDKDVLQKILIVDNNSTEQATIDFLSSLTCGNVEVVKLSQNVGGAGGFNIGIRLAVEKGADYVWVMDDDTIPHNDALEKLINVIKKKDNIGFLASRVLWVDGTEHIMNKPCYLSKEDKGNSLREIKSSSFVSMLICSEAIKKAGLPYREFFIWGDDSEFSDRIYKHGYHGIYVHDSIVIHKTAENYGPEISTAPLETAWKFYYNTRNGLFLRRQENGGIFFLLKELNHLRLYLHNINKRKPNERSIFRKAVLHGYWDGIFFNPKIEYV